MGTTHLQLPPVYLVHNEFLRDDELLSLERQLGEALRYNVREANVILASGIKGSRRAIQELQSLGVAPKAAVLRKIGEVANNHESVIRKANRLNPNKRRKVDTGPEGKEIIIIDSSTESEDEHVPVIKNQRTAS